MKDPHHALKHLTRICLLADLTLMVAWSPEEAGRIIETYKIYQNKPPDMIMEKQEADPHLKVSSFYKVLTIVSMCTARNIIYKAHDITQTCKKRFLLHKVQ